MLKLLRNGTFRESGQAGHCWDFNWPTLERVLQLLEKELRSLLPVLHNASLHLEGIQSSSSRDKLTLQVHLHHDLIVTSALLISSHATYNTAECCL